MNKYENLVNVEKEAFHDRLLHRIVSAKGLSANTIWTPIPPKTPHKDRVGGGYEIEYKTDEKPTPNYLFELLTNVPASDWKAGGKYHSNDVFGMPDPFFGAAIALSELYDNDPFFTGLMLAVADQDNHHLTSVVRRQPSGTTHVVFQTNILKRILLEQSLAVSITDPALNERKWTSISLLVPPSVDLRAAMVCSPLDVTAAFEVTRKKIEALETLEKKQRVLDLELLRALGEGAAA